MAWTPTVSYDFLACAAAAASIGICAAAGAQTAPIPPPSPASSLAPAAPRTVPVLRIDLVGDLDCAKLAADVRAAMNEANPAPGLVVIAVTGTRWRKDVVWSLADAVVGADVPTAVWLRPDRTGKIGLGQAVLGAAASRCYLDPGAAIVSEADLELIEMTPAAVDLERADRELRNWLWVSLKERGADLGLVDVLVSPGIDAWAASPAALDAPARVVFEPAAANPGEAVTPLVTGVTNGRGRVSIPGETARRLRITDGEATAIGQILVAEAVRATRQRAVTVRSGLRDAARDVSRVLPAVDTIVESIGRELDAAERFRSPSPNARRERVHSAAESALKRLQDAADGLTEAEAIVAEYPEVVYLRPPSSTPVGATAADYPAMWRRSFQSRRDAISSLWTRATVLRDE